MAWSGEAGKSDPSERPEARSPIIQKNWNQNEQASGRPIESIIQEKRGKTFSAAGLFLDGIIRFPDIEQHKNPPVSIEREKGR
jgi:hypothetical protein